MVRDIGVRVEEDHADGVVAGRGKFDGLLRQFRTEQGIRELDQHAGTVAGIGIAAAGAPVFEVQEHLHALADHLVGGLPF